MIDTLVAGGPVILPIAACSVVALAMFLERLWALRRSRTMPRAFLQQLDSHVSSGQFDEALILCRGTNAPVARVIAGALESRQRSREQIRDRLEELARREAAELERGVPVVGTIASITPLLGLLGTVGGMIVTFDVIQSQGMGNVGSLAGGISQALVTTFAGLSVGIPALVANRYLLSRVDSTLLDLEEVALGVVEAIEDARS